MNVSVQDDAEHFEGLVSAAHDGELVETAGSGTRPLRPVSSEGARIESGHRILGAGKALTHLPSEEGLERIDREWKQAIEEKAIG